jgi:hypothetical protein
MNVKKRTHICTILVTKYLKMMVQIFQNFVECMNYELSAGTSLEYRTWKKGKEHIGPQLPRFPLSFDPFLPAVRPFHTLGSENIGLPNKFSF